MRRPLDAYYTPKKMLDALMKRQQLRGVIYEPCVGTGHISRYFREQGFPVFTNDIDKACDAETHLDARRPEAWGRRYDWCITNPPYSDAFDILSLAYQNARRGVIFLLRLSFLEPCKNREKFLREHPPTTVLVLPRVSFTGDGKKDTVTCMWCVWDKRRHEQKLEVVSRDEILGV